jgi:hypothetical protein
VAGVTGKDGEKGRVFACDPDREGLAEKTEDSAREPKPKAKAYCGSQRPIDDRKAARSAAQEHWLGQSAMKRHFEAWNG